MTELSRARGALIGLAVGDALGGPLEFADPDPGRPTITEMTGGGWLHLRPGQTTDDTAMALALARSLDERGGHDEQDVVRRYLEWRASSPPDIGITVNAVLGGVVDGAAPRDAARGFHEQSGGKSAGNGSLMRIAPVAVRFASDPEAMVKVARRESTLLHHDPLAADACAWCCLRLARLLRGETAPPAADGLDPRVAEAVVPDRAAAGERAATLGGFVLATLSVAATAVATADDFEEALVWAVNAGGDADTNGAVAGALLGARLGAAAIPARWLEALERRAEIEAVTERLVALAA